MAGHAARQYEEVQDMFGSRIGRRAPVALALAAVAVVSSQALASANSVTPTYSPLTYISQVPGQAVAAGVTNVDVTFGGSGAAPATIPGTLAVSITQGAPGTLAAGYGVQLATPALGTISSLTAAATLEGLDAGNNVVAFDSRVLQAGTQSFGYFYTPTAASVTHWTLLINGFAALATTPTTYYEFAGADTTPAVN